MEQPEKTYSIGTKRGDVNVSDDLRQRVIEVLQQDSVVEDADISVHILKDHVVELSGSVPERRMITRAVELVHELGVAKIENDLILRQIS